MRPMSFPSSGRCGRLGRGRCGRLPMRSTHVASRRRVGAAGTPCRSRTCLQEPDGDMRYRREGRGTMLQTVAGIWTLCFVIAVAFEEDKAALALFAGGVVALFFV